MFRKTLLAVAVSALLFETGCSTCGSCGHPWFNKHRRCDPCENGGAVPPPGVPVVPSPGGAPPPGAVVTPPPVSSGYGPTPDLIATGAYAPQRPVYVNGYGGGCCK